MDKKLEIISKIEQQIKDIKKDEKAGFAPQGISGELKKAMDAYKAGDEEAAINEMFTAMFLWAFGTD